MWPSFGIGVNAYISHRLRGHNAVREARRDWMTMRLSFLVYLGDA